MRINTFVLLSFLVLNPVQADTLTSNSFTVTVEAAASGEPAWSVGIAEQRWTLVGASSVAANAPSPLPAGGVGQAGVTTAWTGAAVDQSTGIYAMGANGGHTDYYGNEIYYIDMRADTPTWARSRTPSDSSGGSAAVDGAGNYGDGQPRATHSYSRPAAGHGRYWLAGLDSMADASGYWTPATYSYDMTQTSGGVWNVHGLATGGSGSGGKWLGGSAAYDPISKKLYTVPHYGFSPYMGMHEIDTVATIAAGDVSPTSTMANVTTYASPSTAPGYSYMAVAPDLRLLIWVTADIGIRTWDLDNMAAGSTSRTTSGTGITPYPGHAVYDPKTRGLIGWTSGLGSSVRVLDIPATLTDTWTWRTVPALSGSATISTPVDSRGPWSKFNIVEDVGGGVSYLVYYDAISTTGIYVYRLPEEGL